MSYDNRESTTRIFVGGLGDDMAKEDLEREFSKYGKLNQVWVAQNPPGFAFIEFEDGRDADEAVKEMNGVVLNGSRLRVEHSRSRGGRRGGRGGGGGGFRGGRGGGGFRGGRGGGGFRRGGRGGGGDFRGGRGGGGGFDRSRRGGYDSGFRNAGESWGRPDERYGGAGGYGGGGYGGESGSRYRSRSPLGPGGY